MSLWIFFLLLVGATAWLGLRLRDPPTAAVAGTLLALSPAVFGNARRYEPNVALAALVAAAAAFLVVHRGPGERRRWILLGLLFGLGMLADRLIFGIYLAPVVVVLLVQALRREPAERRKLLLRWAGVGGVALLVSGYYYFRWFAGHVGEVLSQLQGEIASSGEATSSFPPWTLRGLLYYPLSWLDCQLGLVLGLATLAGVGLYVFRGRRDVEPESRLLLEAWLFGGLVLITLVSKKQPFYSIPLLAPLALVAAIGWRSLPGSAAVRGAVAAVLLAAGVHQLLFLTGDSGLIPTPGRWAWLAGASPLPPSWLDSEYTQAAPPHAWGLRVDEAAALCDERRTASSRPYVLVFSDAHTAPEYQLLPALRLELDTLLVEGFLVSGPAVREHAPKAACLVYVTDGDELWPSASQLTATWEQWGVGVPDAALLEVLRSLGESAEPLASWPTRAEASVHVYALGEAL